MSAPGHLTTVEVTVPGEPAEPDGALLADMLGVG